MKRILVAGIGNIFLGDDAFGCEAVRRLLAGPLPEGVTAVDFGIRSYDLAYSLMDGYDGAILVDAIQRGESPGTLFVVEPDLSGLDKAADWIGNSHSMNPVSVLQMVQSLGGMPGRLLLVGCEPAVLESEDGRMGLSEAVEAALPQAVEIIHTCIRNLIAAVESADTTTKNG